MDNAETQEAAPANKLNSPRDEVSSVPGALVPTDPLPVPGSRLALSGPMIQLPIKLDVGVPIREFRVRHLLALKPGTVVESQWVPGEDVPVVSGDQQLGWSDFEVIDGQLAVRLTRLA